MKGRRRDKPLRLRRCRAGWAGAGGSGRQRSDHRPNQFVEAMWARVRFRPHRAFFGHPARHVRSSPSVRQPGLIRAMVRNARHPRPNRRDTSCDDGADHITVPSLSNQCRVVRDLAPHMGSLPGIRICTMAPFFHPWRDQQTGRDPNNSRSIQCVITRVAADRVMAPVGRVECVRGSCTGIESASLPVFRSM